MYFGYVSTWFLIACVSLKSRRGKKEAVAGSSHWVDRLIWPVVWKSPLVWSALNRVFLAAVLSTVLLASWNIKEFGSFSTDSSRSEGRKTQTCYFGFATAVTVYCKDCYEVDWLLIVESILFWRFLRLLRSFFAESSSSSFLVLFRFALPLTIFEVTWFCVRSGAKIDGCSPLTSNSYCVSSTARGSNFPSRSAMLFSSHFATRLG